jgi:sugar phosphate isomerase/epimerase
LTAATSLPLSALAQGRRVDNVGLQLYTLRNELSQDFEGTLAHVAELGYKEMEFAGYYGRSASEVRSTLDQNGMTSPAAHIQLQALRDDLEGEVERAVILGQKYIVVPILPANQRTISEYQRTAEYLNRAGEVCKEVGIKMGYHNHAFEFEVTDGQIPYDILLDETDADLVDMELDLYWIRNAGVDPVSYFENHPGRFSMLHVKDMDEFGRMVDVGSGEINFAEIFSHADTAGFKHFFVEHDQPGNGLASVAVSIYTVRNIVF